MKNSSENSKKRTITSLFLLISFLYLVPTGIFVFITESKPDPLPHIAGATHWTAATIFLISVIIHITLNWKPLKRYMMIKISNKFVLKKEPVFVFLIVTVLMMIAGTYEFFL